MRRQIYFYLITLVNTLTIDIVNSQTTLKTIDKFPDSGQSKDFTSTFGEDSDYNINPLSYTDLTGIAVIDNNTGLVWQKTDGGEMSFEQAVKYADTLKLGGFEDWRLPTAKEAYTILHHNNSNPAIDRNYFASTGAQYWWTSNQQYNDANKIWVTNAGGGIGNHLKTETISAGGTKKFHTRVVRDQNKPIVIPNHFTQVGQTVIDNITGLMWYIGPEPGILTWEQALSHSENLSIEGYQDWRLPNIKELHSLNDEARSNPSCDVNYFPNVVVNKYWSSTSLSNQAQQAWYWDTRFGITSYMNKTEALNIICVRNVGLSKLKDQSQDILLKINNPVSNYIQLTQYYSKAKYNIYNLYGKLIISSDNIQVEDLSQYPSDYYVLEVITKEKAIRLKFIKI